MDIRHEHHHGDRHSSILQWDGTRLQQGWDAAGLGCRGDAYSMPWSHAVRDTELGWREKGHRPHM